MCSHFACRWYPRHLRFRSHSRSIAHNLPSLRSAVVGFASAHTQTGPAQPLGALGYSWQVSDPGPFGLVLSSTGSLLGVPAGDGILSLTGFG